MNQEYSIVIASIGRSCLHTTLEDILCSSTPPLEVIIVLPHGSNFVLNMQRQESGVNIIILYAAKGQVKQRQVGLLNCACDIIIQLDDDMRFDNTLLECLVYEIFKNNELVVSPLIYDQSLNCKTGVEVGQSQFLRFLYGVDNDKELLRVGYISKIGLAIRPSSLTGKDLVRSDWLPGGCMAFHKKFSTADSEILSPEGKFYGEDVINTHIMKNKGAILCFATKLIIRTDFVSLSSVKDVIPYFRSMINIQKITQGKLYYFKTILFCFVKYFYQTLNKFK